MKLTGRLLEIAESVARRRAAGEFGVTVDAITADYLWHDYCAYKRLATRLRERLAAVSPIGDTAPPLALPPPYVEPEECFTRHYVYHLARSGCRPTLGQLAMTSGLSRSSCQRLRREHEALIRALEGRTLPAAGPPAVPASLPAIPAGVPI